VIPNCVISLMATNKCLRKGCQAYIAFVIKSGKESPKLNSIPIVREFLDVLLEELSGLPLEKKVEVTIDALPKMTLIAQSPYRTAIFKLLELKV